MGVNNTSEIAEPFISSGREVSGGTTHHRSTGRGRRGGGGGAEEKCNRDRRTFSTMTLRGGGLYLAKAESIPCFLCDPCFAFGK